MTIDPAICKAWGIADAGLSPIAERENAVFRVEAHGRVYALRLHRPGYHDEQEIRSELVWTLALSDRGFPVPRPLATQTGALTSQLADGRIATLISWVDGAPIGSAEDGFNEELHDLTALYRDVGALLASLHSLSDTFRPPENFSRPRWDLHALLGNDPLWGRYVGVASLTEEDDRIIRNARDHAREVLRNYAAHADYGLIHADALRENIFFGEGGLTLIDFDDSGFGFRLYDLAVSLSQSLERADYPRLRDALLDGYSQDRPLDEDATVLFPLFAMCRAFASLGWAQTRLASGNPSARTYERRAVIAAKRFLATA